jgi:hypothetical protein
MQPDFFVRIRELFRPLSSGTTSLVEEGLLFCPTTPEQVDAIFPQTTLQVNVFFPQAVNFLPKLHDAA